MKTVSYACHGFTCLKLVPIVKLLVRRSDVLGQSIFERFSTIFKLCPFIALLGLHFRDVSTIQHYKFSVSS